MPQRTTPTQFCYVLRCSNGAGTSPKYWVGLTTDVNQRVLEHTRGNVPYTRQFQSVQLIYVALGSPAQEMCLTLVWMAREGIDAVRGSSWTYKKLTSGTQEHLQRQVRAYEDTCYKCGASGHFADKCTYSQLPEVLSHRGTLLPEVDPRDSDDGSDTGSTDSDHELPAESATPPGDTAFTKRGAPYCKRCQRSGHMYWACKEVCDVRGRSDECSQCGRLGHKTEDCTAVRSICGRPIQ